MRRAATAAQPMHITRNDGTRPGMVPRRAARRCCGPTRNAVQSARAYRMTAGRIEDNRGRAFLHHLARHTPPPHGRRCARRCLGRTGDQLQAPSTLPLQLRAACRMPSVDHWRRAPWSAHPPAAGRDRTSAPWRSPRVARSPPESWCWVLPQPRPRRPRCRPAQAAPRRCRARTALPLPWRSEGLGELISDGERGVQAGHRVLEDHRHAVTAQRAQPAGRRAQQILARETRAAPPGAVRSPAIAP